MELNKRRLIQVSLFIVTFITTTIAGAEWRYGKYFFTEDPLLISQIKGGLMYSVSFLGILTVHEFGHYFMAQYHKVKVTLPFYIPLWLSFIGVPSIGTMGAVIRIKEKINSRKLYFDIGVAGPLAGFFVALGVIIYGFLNLPPLDYLFDIHPEYAEYGSNYMEFAMTNQTDQPLTMIKFGPNLLFWLCENFISFDSSRMPIASEVIHYPFLMAGYLALFFTSLNLFPLGQLDGGHILYGLLGAKVHKQVAPVIFVGLVFYAGLGLIEPILGFDQMLWAIVYVFFLYYCFYSVTADRGKRFIIALAIFTAQYIIGVFFPNIEGYTGWLLFLFVVGRFLGVYHPQVLDDRPLDFKRKVVGWIAVVVFILSFSPRPLIIEVIEPIEVQQKETEDNTGTRLSDYSFLDEPNSFLFVTYSNK